MNNIHLKKEYSLLKKKKMNVYSIIGKLKARAVKKILAKRRKKNIVKSI